MFGGDTSLHRGGNVFPSTRWSRILVSAADGDGVPEPYLADLASNYWRPVYAYIRTRWSQTNEDAKDLTQEFFAWVMESGFVGRADPERGSFRGFLKVALEHFLTDADRKQRREKRGGGIEIRSMQSVSEDDPAWDVSDPGQRTPDAVLDDIWRREVLRRVLEGMEDGYRCEGREVYFSVFRDYYLQDEVEVSYADLAVRYDIDHNAVSNHLQHAKRRYRDVLRQALADTVESTAALDAEVAWFTGGRE